MEMWDGSFEMPGQTPVQIASSHVPLATTSYSKGAVEKAAADVGTTPSSVQRVDSVQTNAAAWTHGGPKRFRINMIYLLSALAVATLIRLCPTVFHIQSVVVNSAFMVLSFTIAIMTMEGALNWDIWGPTRIGSAPPRNEQLPLSDLCSQIRGALKQYRPTGGELYDALVEATHRCCRIVNIAGDTTDVQVIEAVALVKNRLPALLTAYERTQAVGDPKELWAAADRMAEAVVMVGDQAEAARKRLLALATDGLETEVRYLSARTGRDDLGLSSILAPVN